MTIGVGDLVARKSYECDIIFRVLKINNKEGLIELAGEIGSSANQ